MKTILRSFAVLAILTVFNKVNAQCTVGVPTVSNIQQSDGTFTFDLTFKISGNGGNKVTAIYIYKKADYNALPANFYGNNNKTIPTEAALTSAKVLSVIKLSNDDGTKSLTSYQRINGTYNYPAFMQGGLSYSGSALTGEITVKGIQLTFTDLQSLISLKADVISTQTPDLNNITCLARGLEFAPNEPLIRAIAKGCGSARTLTTTFTTTEERTIYFRIYKDVPDYSFFTGDDTTTAVSPLYVTTTAFNGTVYTTTKDYTYNVQPGEQFNVWVVAYADGVPNVSAAFAANSCAPLPITFRSFSAQRNKQTVLVKWETATEQSNRGFNVQRQAGNGTWQNIGFVASQAINGNSSSDLSYSFTDFSPVKGVSQYRLQQVDVDGKLSYSEVRSVRSEELAGGVTVYPNPSSDGRITIAFDGAAVAKDITVSDMAGRVVKRFTGVKNNNLTIENLNAGFYTIQIFDPSTSTTAVEKVVVKKQ